MVEYDSNKLYVCVTYTPEFQSLLDNLCVSLTHPNIEVHVNKAELQARYDGFRSRGWFECLKLKLQFFYDFFSKLPDGAVVCSIDADIQFFRPGRLYELKRQLDRSTLECYGQSEHHARWLDRPNTGVANGGFFMFKKNARVLEWLQAVLAQNFNRRFLGDQEYLNHFMRQKRVQYQLLPPPEFLHGGPVSVNDLNFIDRARIVMHHATYCKTVEEKQAQMTKLRELCNFAPVDWQNIKNTNPAVVSYVAGQPATQQAPGNTRSPEKTPADKQQYALVLARCMEDVSWAAQWQNTLDVFVYNKCGEPAPTFKAAWLKLPNVGREAHTYLTHIIAHYDNLHAVTIFLQGRIDDAHAYPAAQLMKYIEPAKKNGFSASHLMLVKPSHWNNIDFLSIPKYAPKVRSGALRINKAGLLAYAHTYFGPLPALAVSTYTGCFAASREAIKKYPKSFYVQLRDTLGDHDDPEEAHFMERLWAHMFSGTAYVPELLGIPENKRDKFIY